MLSFQPPRSSLGETFAGTDVCKLGPALHPFGQQAGWIPESLHLVQAVFPTQFRVRPPSALSGTHSHDHYQLNELGLPECPKGGRK